jgi:4-amino-4-deoxy-L-arabinose transferase-like glycosyltransferase
MYGPVARKINLFCLLAAIISVLVFPLKKELWYDETISVLCSKGISHDSHLMFANQDTVSSQAIQKLNTVGNVHIATVVDNGNSFLYNEGLHWFTSLAGNSLFAYTLFTKLAGIAVLIALYVLAGLLFGESIFISLAVALLATDVSFMSIGNEVRAYMLATCFITIAAINFYQFMYRDDKPKYLLLLGLFSAAAILCHFLSVYIVLVFVGYLLVYKSQKLLTAPSIAAIAVPIVLVGIYFLFSYKALVTMSSQNKHIEHAAANEGFNLGEVLFRSMHLSSLDFKVVFSSFRKTRPVIFLSFLTVLALYISAVQFAADRTDKKRLHLLFLLGFSSTVFLGLLSLKAHHYTSLYLRYHAFCLPFGALFTAYALSVLVKSGRLNRYLKTAVVGFFIVPALAIYLLSVMHGSAIRVYNHYAVAQQIKEGKMDKLGVANWRDAFLVNSFLPDNYKIDYVRKENGPYFTLYKAGREETIRVLNQ